MDNKKEVTAADLKRGGSAKDVKNGSGFGHMQITLIFRPVSVYIGRRLGGTRGEGCVSLNGWKLGLIVALVMACVVCQVDVPADVTFRAALGNRTCPIDSFIPNSSPSHFTPLSYHSRESQGLNSRPPTDARSERLDAPALIPMSMTMLCCPPLAP